MRPASITNTLHDTATSDYMAVSASTYIHVHKYGYVYAYVYVIACACVEIAVQFCDSVRETKKTGRIQRRQRIADCDCCCGCLLFSFVLFFMSMLIVSLYGIGFCNNKIPYNVSVQFNNSIEKHFQTLTVYMYVCMPLSDPFSLIIPVRTIDFPWKDNVAYQHLRHA